MKEKLNLQDLIDKMSRETGAMKKDAELFMRTFFSLVSDSLLSDRVVKINGIGTFKLVPVRKRESVDVNTKEKNESPARYKLSFLPDAGLKEMVNEPFSAFETVEINESASAGKHKKETGAGDKNKITKRKPSADNKSAAQDTDTELPAEKKVSENIPTTGKANTPVAIGAIAGEKKDIPGKQPPAGNNRKKRFRSKPKKKNYIDWIIVAVAIVLLVVLVYMWYGYLSHRQPAVVEDDVIVSEVPVARTETDKPAGNTAEASFQKPEAVAEGAKPAPASSQQEPTVEAELLDVITLEYGNRLTLVAEKYYGHKVFWVYLYEFNRERIKNPNNVPAGTRIDVPVPETYGIDIYNGESVRKASALSEQILKEFY